MLLSVIYLKNLLLILLIRNFSIGIDVLHINVSFNKIKILFNLIISPFSASN